jgi:hypothetical protein
MKALILECALGVVESLKEKADWELSALEKEFCDLTMQVATREFKREMGSMDKAMDTPEPGDDTGKARRKTLFKRKENK